MPLALPSLRSLPILAVVALLTVCGRAAPTPGITHVTADSRDFFRPPEAPADQDWVYQTACPFQVAPDRAAIFCSIRQGGAKAGGLQVGDDVIVFDRLPPAPPLQTVVVSRNELGTNPRSQPADQPALLSKQLLQGGFVPRGAKRRDGSPHPHAGTGFGITLVIAQRVGGAQGSLAEFPGEQSFHFHELYQFAYDGAKFSVTGRQRLMREEVVPGWTIVNTGMRNAIADGDDLLMGMVASRIRGTKTEFESGVVRWRRDGDRWLAVAYTPVSSLDDEGDASEPSLIRDVDDSLLFCARGGRNAPEVYNDIRIWRSTDGGGTWRKIIHARGAISTAPLTLNQAADGTPYVAANLYEVLMEAPDSRSITDNPVYSIRPDAQGRYRLGGWLRNRLYLWPLNATRHALEAPRLIRDTIADFGRPPGRTSWRIDHPSGMNLRLADGRWHSVLGFRVMELGEGSQGLPPTAQTGAYLEEVVSTGAEWPVWNF
ncbi:MAG: hypothetical protein JNG83_08100 [Opitutaceae bacterium]|nr:hypothetical protein [Opitutaceae bacterium]